LPKHAFLDKNIVLHTKIEMDDAGFQKFPGLLSGSLASAEAMFVDTHLDFSIYIKHVSPSHQVSDAVGEPRRHQIPSF